MSKKPNLYKLEVNKVLANCPQEYISYQVLCQNKKENFEPVFYYLIELLDGLEKHKKNYNYKLLNGLISFIKCFNENKVDIVFELKERIKLVKEDYFKIIEKNNQEPDRDIIETIEELLIEINKNNFDNEITDTQTKKEESNNHEIELLNKKIEELNKRIEMYKSKNEKTENKKKTLYEEIRKQKETINELSNEKNTLEQIIENCKEQLTNEQNNNQNLQNEIEHLEELNTKLTNYLKSAEQKIKQLEEELNKISKEDQKKQKQEQHKKALDDKIISLCIDDIFSLNKLEIVLNNNGFNCTEKEILDSFKRISQRINLINHRKKSYPQTYQAAKPLYDTNCNFRINNYNDTLDLLITSDWHITSLVPIDKTLPKIEKIYDYCTLNNIELIINLGDFLDIEQQNRRDKYYTTMKLLEDIIEQFPKNNTINHAILGGNHDKRMFEVGVDPLNYLTNNRKDYINLGYDDAKIIFSKNTENQIIGLHHPDAYRINVNDIKEFQIYILNYLTTFNDINELGDNQTYLNLFGHFHISRLDLENNYAIVPALMRTNIYNHGGLWHVKLYFDSFGNIDYLTIKSLISDKQLLPVNEIVYQKRK